VSLFQNLPKSTEMFQRARRMKGFRKRGQSFVCGKRCEHARPGSVTNAPLFHLDRLSFAITRFSSNFSASAMADDAMPPIRRFATPADMMQHLVKVRRCALRREAR
jgi:hypothetical protein